MERAIPIIQSAEILPKVAVQQLSEVSKLIVQVKDQRERFVQEFSGLASSSVSDFRPNAQQLESTLAHANQIVACPLPESLKGWIFERIGNLESGQESFAGLLAKIRTARSAGEDFSNMAQIDPALWCGKPSLDGTPLAELLSRCRYARENSSALRDYLSFLLAEDHAADCALGPVLAAYGEAKADYANLVKAAELVFYRSAAELVLNADPRLKRHTGATHEQLRLQYQKLDREYLELQRVLLASRLASNSIPEGNGVGKVADLTQLALVP